MYEHISWSLIAVTVLQTAFAHSLPIIRPELPIGKHCCPIQQNFLWSKEIRGLDSAAAGLLAPLLNYRFLLPELQLRDGLEHLGTAVRLRSFVSDLITARRPLKIGVLGGSISWGEGATARVQTDWFSVFTTWLSSLFPSAGVPRVTTRNGCVPGTPSSYVLLCLEHAVDPDVDLVLVEYGVNDGFADQLLGNSVVMSHERLVRRLMELPGRPAVVGVAVPHLKSTSFGAFHTTSEDVQGSLSAYYDFPAVSLRNALYLPNVRSPGDALTAAEEVLTWNRTFVDAHPGDAGHKALADLVVHLIQETALGLVRHPVSETEVQRRREGLPPPMYEGNLPLPTLTRSCMLGSDLGDLAVAAKGWMLVNEGTAAKPKWGYVATTPGSYLKLRLNTTDPRVSTAAGAAAKQSGAVSVLLQYVKTYQPVMGKVLVSCEGGCNCHRLTLDGWHSARVSQISMAHLKISRADSNATTCELRVTVEGETSAQGYRFKVSGVVISVGYELEGMYEHKYWRIPDD